MIFVSPLPSKNGPCMTSSSNIKEITLPSPAKLNLFLHITGQRPDGYHNLQNIFQFLDYGDTLTFQSTNDGQLSLTPDIDGVKEEDNLIIKAARALQQLTGCTQGAKIQLKKLLLMEVRLVEGNSNPATTM